MEDILACTIYPHCISILEACKRNASALTFQTPRRNWVSRLVDQPIRYFEDRAFVRCLAATSSNRSSNSERTRGTWGILWDKSSPRSSFATFHGIFTGEKLIVFLHTFTFEQRLAIMSLVNAPQCSTVVHARVCVIERSLLHFATRWAALVLENQCRISLFKDD